MMMINHLPHPGLLEEIGNQMNLQEAVSVADHDHRFHTHDMQKTSFASNGDWPGYQ